MAISSDRLLIDYRHHYATVNSTGAYARISRSTAQAFCGKFTLVAHPVMLASRRRGGMNARPNHERITSPMRAARRSRPLAWPARWPAPRGRMPSPVRRGRACKAPSARPLAMAIPCWTAENRPSSTRAPGSRAAHAANQLCVLERAREIKISGALFCGTVIRMPGWFMSAARIGSTARPRSTATPCSSPVSAFFVTRTGLARIKPTRSLPVGASAASVAVGAEAYGTSTPSRPARSMARRTLPEAIACSMNALM